MTNVRPPLAALCAALLCVGPLRAQDPFAAQPRWSSAAPSAAPWLPSGLALAAGGELVWATGQGSAPCALLLSTAPALGLGALAPTRSVALPGAYGAVAAAVGDDERELFTAVQYPQGSTSQRRTEVARHDARDGSMTAPVWRRDVGPIGNGATKLAVARDGGRVLCAVHDAQRQSLALEWLGGTDGSTLAAGTVPAQTLRQLAAAADLSRVALVVGGELRVYDDSAALEHLESLSGSTQALAIDAAGSVVAVGSGARVRLLARSASGWNVVRELGAGAGEVATRAALADDGRVLALGWWNGQTARDVRLQVWDLTAHVLRYERLISAPAGAPQNYVESALVSQDGRRAAFGCWGTSDPQPEALLVDVASGAELFALDLPGSVRALALDSRGTRLAVGSKSTHANVFSAAGEWRLYDTGERQLQLVEEPRAGGTLHLAARAPGASRVIFFVGPVRATPQLLPGGAAWWIDRRYALRYSCAVSPAGRAELVTQLSPTAAGVEWAVQVVERLPGGGLRIGAELVEPVVF